MDRVRRGNEAGWLPGKRAQRYASGLTRSPTITGEVYLVAKRAKITQRIIGLISGAYKVGAKSYLKLNNRFKTAPDHTHPIKRHAVFVH